MLKKVTSRKPTNLLKNEFLDLGDLNNLQTVNLKIKIKSSRGMNNTRKTNSLKQSNKEKATAVDNDLANGCLGCYHKSFFKPYFIHEKPAV